MASYSDTNEIHYYHQNHLWSTIAISDESATILEQYDYDSFGTPYLLDNNWNLTDISNSTLTNTRLYTGREYDTETGLYYNRARYYSPTHGRFISRDPIDIADDVNLYAYVANNPVMYTDRMGLEKYNVIIPNKPPSTAEEHYARNQYNVGLPRTINDIDPKEWILLSEFKSAFHSDTFPLTTFNKKYISKDWFREAVYNSETWLLDTSPENMWTYNYYHPILQPKLHVKYDVEPYFYYWNTANDSTSIASRPIRWWIKWWVAKTKEVEYNTKRYANTFNQRNFIMLIIEKYGYR